MFDYRSGAENILPIGIHADSADIKAGDALTLVSGYVAKVTTAASAVWGIARDTQASPATSGAKSVRVSVSREAVYEVKPSAGSFAVGDVGKKVDVAANAQQVIRTTSTRGDIEILSVDTARNTARIRINAVFATA